MFDTLFSIACLLFAIRLAKILGTKGTDLLGNIPVTFFPVYSTINLRTAHDDNLMSQIPHFCTVSVLKKGLRIKDGHNSGKLLHLYIFVVLMSNSWDVETNPGPDSRSPDDSHFPCGLCDVSVGWEDRGICCDTCNVWYHIVFTIDH